MRDFAIGFGGTSYTFVGLPLAEWVALFTVIWMCIRIYNEIQIALEKRRKKKNEQSQAENRCLDNRDSDDRKL